LPLAFVLFTFAASAQIACAPAARRKTTASWVRNRFMIAPRPVRIGTIIANGVRKKKSAHLSTVLKGVSAPMGHNHHTAVTGKGHSRKPCLLLPLAGLVLLSFLFARPAAAQPRHERLIYSHPLTSAADDQGLLLRSTDGRFGASGWQSLSPGSQLLITLPEGLPLEGTCSVRVSNFDPCEQNVSEKQPIINLYSQPCGNKEIYETDGGWFHLISGTLYQTGDETAGFKFWAAPRGVESKTEEEVMLEARWNPARSYEFTFVWDRSTLFFLVDGVERMRLAYAGQVEPFRYIFLGKDNLTRGYTAQPGPVFSDLRLYAPAEQDPPPAPPAGVRVIHAE